METINNNYNKIPVREKINGQCEYVKQSVHHIVNKTNGGSNSRYNRVGLTEFEHKTLHKLFGNRSPHEILELVLKITGSSFKNEVLEKIQEALNEEDKSKLYKKGVIKDYKRFK